MRGGSIASFEVSVLDDIYDVTNSPFMWPQKTSQPPIFTRILLRFLFC